MLGKAPKAAEEVEGQHLIDMIIPFNNLFHLNDDIVKQSKFHLYKCSPIGMSFHYIEEEEVYCVYQMNVIASQLLFHQLYKIIWLFMILHK